MALKCRKGELLSRHTSFRIGGPASFWFEPQDFDGLLEAISVAEKDRKALAVIGKGSNILAQDKGFDGAILNLGRQFDYIEIEENEMVRVGAACALSRLVKECAESGLGGCEFLAGIPGSFGGAVFMNAGVRDVENPERLREVKDIISDVDTLDLRDKRRKTLERRDIDFSYRSSGLDGRCILAARIKLEKAKKGAIINRIDSFLKRREWIKKLGHPSAGSIFKNPDVKNPAGKLIEDCGLKGRQIGGAEISRVHANFIVNIGGAASKDVLGLIDLAKGTVKERFGIEMELELRVL